MSGFLSEMLASVSLFLRQPLESFCDVETHHPGAGHADRLVTLRGEYVSVLRVNGLRTMCSRADVEALAEQQRIELQSLLESSGHAIEGWYISDPDQAGVAVDLLALNGCQQISRMMNADFDDIINERRRRWPQVMRWEDACYILWTRPAILTREEKKQLAAERKEQIKAWPKAGNGQRFTLRSDLMAGRHDAFVSRVQDSMSNLGISTTLLGAAEAVTLARETLYRETAGSGWKPTLVGDRVMARFPDSEKDLDKPEHALWPSLRDQIFNADAETIGGQLATVGDYTYAPVDMLLGPEDPRPFSELLNTLGRKRLPWRSSMILEGGGKSSFAIKETGALLLGMFPANKDIQRAFASLKRKREAENHNSVRLRMTAATWAPLGEEKLLRRRAADLSQGIESWGGCKTTRVPGDPLEAAMGSVPVLSLGSTATPALAPLGDAMAMMPWMRSASPFTHGSILFRKPDGGIWAFDPTGGGVREHIADIIVAPPGSGKTVLGNTILLGLLLSSAAMGNNGVKLPLLAKIDIGPASLGFIEMIRNALGPDRAHEAVFIEMQMAPGFEVNIFDLQVGLEYPLPLEEVAVQNFVSLLATPLNGIPFEGMDQLVEECVSEAYRQCTGVAGGSPKHYREGIEPLVDAAIHRLGIQLPHHAASPGDPDSADPTWWRDVVTALIEVGEHRLAGMAQRHAVPVLQDLLAAARSPEIYDRFSKIILPTEEKLVEAFERYIMSAIKKYPTLAEPTQLDLGDARIIVLDLGRVAPQGSDGANRQTALMYMLGRHLIGRNFFLHPEYADLPIMPQNVREYHRGRFTEMKETIKRLDFEEWHRAKDAPQVDKQAIRDVREGRKHNVQLSFISQRSGDFSGDLVGQSTARWILKCGDEREANEMIENFKLTPASAYVVRHRLPGPGRNGAPFFLVMNAAEGKYEQLLVNVLGPIELWAFSSTPNDTALRSRLFARMPSSRALRCLAIVFPGGSAEKELTRRKAEAMKTSFLQEEQAQQGVMDALVDEILSGQGIAVGLYDRLDAMDEQKRAAA
ncbi:secretion protein [Gluconobacter albidus]|uniref:Secretion protein n=1 Tax=Gluconobacter albidus TaxID=318683 RepID=A0A149TLY4_9PROT|nr:secretion protein [Gluconobacter albidus]KXV49945.1 secretion protein [Gluconobacter albidus]